LNNPIGVLSGIQKGNRHANSAGSNAGPMFPPGTLTGTTLTTIRARRQAESRCPSAPALKWSPAMRWTYHRPEASAIMSGSGYLGNSKSAERVPLY
jgi:hypothetical protein